MPEVTPSKYLVMASWDDVPHLSEQAKQELWASTPHHLRKARAKGIPALGSGAIFPVEESLITVAPFPIPPYFRQINGLDFGWDHPTAACNLAWDTDQDVIYVTRCYKASEQPVVVHAAAVKGFGAWVPTAWPHDGNNDTAAGEALAKQYAKQGVKMLAEHATFAKEEGGGNSVEGGLMQMLDRMLTGKWKVFSTCTDWFEEYRLYHRKDGLVVKEFDDAICASRYAFMMRRHAITKPAERQKTLPEWNPFDSEAGW